MTFLYIFGSLLLAFIAYMRFEATFLEVTHIRFTKSKKCLKIIHLSDIHMKYLRVPAKKVRAVIEKEGPDTIIITGDYIEGKKDIPRFLAFLDEMPGNIPVFLCLGNHDYKALKKAGDVSDFIKRIEDKHAEVLHNRSACFIKNGRQYNIAGLGDLREGSPDVSKSLKTACRNPILNIAISHNPDIIFDIPQGGVDYLFCGHFHGGQIWAPFDLEFKILRNDRLCKMGIKRGLHRLNGINLYINRGLGNVCFPLRFMSRPEITVYYLK